MKKILTLFCLLLASVVVQAAETRWQIWGPNTNVDQLIVALQKNNAANSETVFMKGFNHSVFLTVKEKGYLKKLAPELRSEQAFIEAFNQLHDLTKDFTHEEFRLFINKGVYLPVPVAQFTVAEKAALEQKIADQKAQHDALAAQLKKQKASQAAFGKQFAEFKRQTASAASVKAVNDRVAALSDWKEQTGETISTLDDRVVDAERVAEQVKTELGKAVTTATAAQAAAKANQSASTTNRWLLAGGGVALLLVLLGVFASLRRNTSTQIAALAELVSDEKIATVAQEAIRPLAEKTEKLLKGMEPLANQVSVIQEDVDEIKAMFAQLIHNDQLDYDIKAIVDLEPHAAHSFTVSVQLSDETVEQKFLVAEKNEDGLVRLVGVLRNSDRTNFWVSGIKATDENIFGVLEKAARRVRIQGIADTQRLAVA